MFRYLPKSYNPESRYRKKLFQCYIKTERIRKNNSFEELADRKYL